MRLRVSERTLQKLRPDLCGHPVKGLPTIPFSELALEADLTHLNRIASTSALLTLRALRVGLKRDPFLSRPERSKSALGRHPAPWRLLGGRACCAAGEPALGPSGRRARSRKSRGVSV